MQLCLLPTLVANLKLPSFPTRRSSDLGSLGGAAAREAAGQSGGTRSDSAVDARARTAASVDARRRRSSGRGSRSEDHTSELQSPCKLVCRLLLAKLSK